MEDSEQCKLFVGGISWDTTEDVLKDHFAKYGEVLGSVIARDRNSGHPRGFAFVTFSESSAVDRALQDSHQILSRTVEVKRAIPRSEQQSQQHNNRGLIRNNSRTNSRSVDQFRTKKIFVGGLSANLTEEEFRRYFEKFGSITDVVVMHDNVTHRPRGFGFITFDSEDSVEEVMQKNFHELTGKLVEVKRAVPKDGIGINNIVYNGSERSPGYNSYQQQGNFAAAFNSRFGYFPGYGNVAGYPYGAGIYSCGYPSGGYGGIGYGFAPVSPRSPWSPGVVGVRGSFLPYGSAAPYGGPAPMTLSVNGFSGFQHLTESTAVGANSLGGRNLGGAANKQSQRVFDKSYQAANST